MMLLRRDETPGVLVYSLHDRDVQPSPRAGNAWNAVSFAVATNAPAIFPNAVCQRFGVVYCRIDFASGHAIGIADARRLRAGVFWGDRVDIRTTADRLDIGCSDHLRTSRGVLFH